MFNQENLKAPMVLTASTLASAVVIATANVTGRIVTAAKLQHNRTPQPHLAYRPLREWQP
jgi:hypothetical protein